MFGWELPPYNSGGLGTASLGLTKSLADLNVDIDFVIPKVHGPFPFDHMRIHSADGISEESGDVVIPSFVRMTPEELRIFSQTIGYGYRLQVDAKGQLTFSYSDPGAGISPHAQAAWYAQQAASIAKQHNFELIHCHDWFTYYCGMTARRVANARGDAAPFIAHIHATEYDRGGSDGGNRVIAAIEKAGLNSADRVVAVSHYTKKMVHQHYNVPLSKISVVHNGLPTHEEAAQFDLHELKKHYKIVLSLGRITMQKGPEHFLMLAKAVTDKDPNVKFVMVGNGDMEKRCIEMAARMGLTGKVLFSSFLRDKDVDRAYQLADLFVMPSISEPFGLVALEAMRNGTPTLVSKQSGVAEVTDNVIKVDFWDIDKMSSAVLHVLHDPHYAHHLRSNGLHDLKSLTWHHSAAKLKEVYQELLDTVTPPTLQPVYTNA